MGVEHRTVQVSMQDCRFAFDLASRNAIWGVAEHMAAGVEPFKKPPFQKPNSHHWVRPSTVLELVWYLGGEFM